MDIKEFKCSDKIVLPSEGETVAIAHKVKTAAFCYDRIWSPSYEEVPGSVRCFGGSSEELALMRILSDVDLAGENLTSMLKAADTWQKRLKVLDKGLSPISFSPLFYFLLKASNDYSQSLGFKNILDVPKDQLDKILSDTVKLMWDNPKKLEKFFKDNFSVFCKPIFRKISKSFYKKHRIPMIPIYGSVKERDIQYKEGDRKAIVIALSNIKVVNEDNLTWEQVLEFRNDVENKQKYKRFLHWLDKEMVGKSQAFVEDEISTRLDDYEQALKKHGIKTIVGTVEEALDGKYLLGVSGVAGSLTLAGHPVLGMLAAGFLIGGKIGVKLMQTKLGFDEVERGPNFEISWVYEAKKLDR